MKFIDLLESKIDVYHGDNYKTKKIDVKLMNNGNNQEGIGIYFANEEEIAHTYGKDIVKATIDTSKFIDSRKNISIIGKSKIAGILKRLHATDSESFYYLITDYGIDVDEDDVENHHFSELANIIKSEEVRNFQIDMANRFNTETFVKVWNEVTKIDGTFQKQTATKIWYAIINTKIKLTQI